MKTVLLLTLLGLLTSTQGQTNRRRHSISDGRSLIQPSSVVDESRKSKIMITDLDTRTTTEVVDPNSKVAAEDLKVLGNHVVTYSNPPVNKDYKTSSKFNDRGMKHVYTLTHLFLDLIQRDNVLPETLNASVLLDTDPEDAPKLIEEHWSELLLQYIGVVTVAICGLLFALCIPIVCLCVCCCRCAGKCGAYPEHFDKRSDACKRFTLGVLLSLLVIAAMFGVVCAFVTNYYTYSGTNQLPTRLQKSAVDTSLYLDNTGREINGLLVTNFAELEEVLNQILDESGPILKRSLAEVTQAVAIDDLTDIVSNLGAVKRHLREIQNKTLLLQDKVGQLKLGLNGTRARLLAAMNQCRASRACKEFLGEYNISHDLAIAVDFGRLPMELPDLSLLMKDISDLMNNDIERKVRGGQAQLDKVTNDIERSIGDIRPKIKAEIRRMGKQLADHAAEIQRFLSEFEGNVEMVNSDVPKLKPWLDEYGEYLFYIGLGMSFMVLLILMCFVFGLFYGFCGKRPGNMYGDDCCNTGTGSNWLIAGVYLTFLFSFVLLIITTAQFLVGSTVDKVGCQALQRPNDSDVFQLLDERFIQPLIDQQRPKVTSSDAEAQWSMSVSQLVSNCHDNMTLYNLLDVGSIYNVENLRRWRSEYGIGDFVENLKRKIRLDDLKGIQILSPEAERELQELAESEISDLNFGQYTDLLEEKITAINLATFTSRLRQVRERLTRNQARLVGPAIDNEALFLDQMQRVVMDMKLAVKDLVNSVQALEVEAKHTKPNLREALTGLIKQATQATRFLRDEGPQLVDKLTDRYVNETVGLIDAYVERVINHTKDRVGRCEPLSNSLNATIISVCNEIVDPFNGFWASIGWCVMLFLPSVAIALSLVSLYRKSEPYPGPLVETMPVAASESAESQHVKKKRRGHRRNASEYLPDSAHYRAGYAYTANGVAENRFSDVAPRNTGAAPSASAAGGSSSGSSGPPRYSSNPNLEAQPLTEYERPPPYYYPGSAPVGDAPPPLPAPNQPRA